MFLRHHPHISVPNSPRFSNKILFLKAQLCLYVLDCVLFINLLNSLLQTADNGGVSVVNNILDSYGAPVARSPFVPLLVSGVKCR